MMAIILEVQRSIHKLFLRLVCETQKFYFRLVCETQKFYVEICMYLANRIHGPWAKKLDL